VLTSTPSSGLPLTAPIIAPTGTEQSIVPHHASQYTVQTFSVDVAVRRYRRVGASVTTMGLADTSGSLGHTWQAMSPHAGHHPIKPSASGRWAPPAPALQSPGYVSQCGTSRLFVEYLSLLRGWCAGLRPPTICAKSYMAYFVSTHYYMLRLQNSVLSAASTRAIYTTIYATNIITSNN
jgi:hypothetical protein